MDGFVILFKISSHKEISLYSFHINTLDMRTLSFKGTFVIV